MPFSNVVGGAFKFHDGHEMPKIGLGVFGITSQESLDIAVEAALKSGYRFFDTANLYKNEQFLGESLKKFLPVFGLTREDVFITTKFRTIDENTLEATEKQLNESLEKLQTSYIDLVLIHYPRDRVNGHDEAVEVNKRGRKTVWQFLEGKKEAGIIRSIGVSNYEVYHLVEMFEYAKFKPVLNQYEYQPYLTRPILKQFCHNHNIVVQAFSSLCRGNQDILQEPIVQNLAKKHNVSTQIILYAFGYCDDVGIIPKSATPSRIHDNLHTTITVKLSKEDISSLLTLDKHLLFCKDNRTWTCL